MLTEIVVYNAAGSVIKARLPLVEPTGTSPYFIKNVDGLGPVPAQLVFSDFADSDGEYFQDAKIRARNIVISAGYRADYINGKSVEAVRRELYAALPPKGAVRLRFLNSESETVYIDGRVESHEPNIFTQEPEVQISVMCPLPLLRSLVTLQVNGLNNTLIDTGYAGSGTTDIIARLRVNRSINQVILRSAGQTDVVYTGDLQAGDVLSFTTTPGAKALRRSRGGSTSSVLNGLTSGSLSTVLGPDNRTLQMVTPGAADIPMEVLFNPKYLGI